MTSLYAFTLLVFGVILGLAIAGAAYHVGYITRDIKEHLTGLKSRLNAFEQEQADDTPNVIEPVTPKEQKLRQFDPEDEDSAIITPLSPKEVAQQKHQRMLKEIEEAENA
jgi:hypothetical protein